MDYIETLKQWEARVADPVIFAHLDELLPSYAFQMVSTGSSPHWASRFKVDGTLPKRRVREKTVVYPDDMNLREQGDWGNPVRVLDRLKDEMRAVSIYEVYAAVSGRYSLDMPRPQDSAAPVLSRRGEILGKLRDYFSWCLREGKSAKASSVRAYLRGRGFSPESVEKLGFGFVPSWSAVLGHFVTRGGYSREEFDNACRVCGGSGRTMVGASHTLAIPYVCGGELSGFIFRRVDGDGDPKYIASTGLDRKSVFFNMPRKASDVVVVEGEMDALTATSAGIPCVVSMGGSAIAGERRRQVADAFGRGVTRIFLCPDLDALSDGSPDVRGRYDAIMRSVHTIKDVDISFEQIYVVELPRVCDPDEFIRTNGAAAFIGLLREAVPFWEYACRYHRSLGTCP